MTVVVLKTERAEINERVVLMLEQALEEARNGEILAIGIAVVRPGSHTNCGFSDYDVAGVLLGAVALLQHRLMLNVEPGDD